MSNCVLLDEYKHNLAAVLAHQLEEEFEQGEAHQGIRLFEEGDKEVNNLQIAITWAFPPDQIYRFDSELFPQNVHVKMP